MDNTSAIRNLQSNIDYMKTNHTISNPATLNVILSALKILETTPDIINNTNVGVNISKQDGVWDIKIPVHKDNVNKISQYVPQISEQDKHIWHTMDFLSGKDYADFIRFIRKQNIPLPFSRSMYAGKNSHEINYISHIISLDSAMYNDGKYKNKVLYRGISSDMKEMIDNGIIVNKAFTPITHYIDDAKKYTDNLCCIIAFMIPDDVKYFEATSMMKQELILQRNTQFIHFKQLPHGHRGTNIYSCILTHYTVPDITQQEYIQQNNMVNYVSNMERLKSSLLDIVEQVD